jgi:hypothetical protein
MFPNGQPSESPQQQLTAAGQVDPHAMRLMPVWSIVQVLAEPGSLLFHRDHGNGVLSIFVREPNLAAWPPGTPPLMPGEQVQQIMPPSNGWHVRTNNAVPVDHVFQPSLLDPQTCKICAMPARQRWVVQAHRKTEIEGQLKNELHWFDELDDAITQRVVLANDPEVVGIGLAQAMYREDTDSDRPTE